MFRINLRHFLPLFIIILLALFLRLHQLGVNPPSLDWDEASLGYNAYSILKTGNDEYGNHLPFSFRSFNDYKPPLYVYLTVPSIKIFGLNEFAIRLPSALAGTITVIFTYFLVLHLFKDTKKNKAIALTSALLLAISPWHLQFSRVAFEANIGLTCLVMAVTFFLIWIDRSKLHYLLLSAITAVAGLYAYHSARVVIPVMFLFLFLQFRKKLISNKQTLVGLILGIILCLPLGVLLIRGSAAQRFSAVSIFTNPGEFSRERERVTRIKEFHDEDRFPLKFLHTNASVLGKLVLRDYFEHFNADFLFLTGDQNARHGPAGMGLLYLAELPALLVGGYLLVKNKPKRQALIWAWLLIGPIPAALTTSTPHAVRGLMMLPAWQIITAYGLVHILENSLWKIDNSNGKLKIENRHRTSGPISIFQFLLPFSNFKKLISIIYLSLFLINFLSYLNLYYVISPVERSQDWQYGYKQLVQYIAKVESKYDRIIVTTKYDQPYIYFAFYNHVDPKIYQSFAENASSRYGKYVFKSIEFRADIQSPHTLVVAEPDRSPKDYNKLMQINFLNGQPAFNIYSHD